jgi:porphobilinogen synthase
VPFPIHRPRRLRSTESIRSLVRETRLAPSQFILPLFVCPGEGVRREILSMPGNYQLSIDELVKECAEVQSLGIGGVILFGLPETKDEIASGAYADDGIVQRAIRAIKRELPKLLVITDVCNCEYTSHGHCGKVVDNDVDNDATLNWLALSSVSHALAGADIVAPSDMMDGRVAAIRAALDYNGFQKTPILSYAAKFASVFYGPFRDAADSAPQFGDRRSYQMDPANGREAMREIELDLEEGADMIMIKPALAYLDLIWEARQRFDVPIGAYQVSGEFSMIMGGRAKRLDRPGARHDGDTNFNPPRRGRFRVYLFRQTGCEVVGLAFFRNVIGTLTQLVQRGFEPAGKLVGRTGPPIMEEIEHRLTISHVVVHRHHVQPVRPQRFQHRGDLRRKHRYVTGDLRVSVTAKKRRPGVQPHSSIDRRAHLPHLHIVSAHRDFVDCAVLLALVADNLGDFRRVYGSG